MLQPDSLVLDLMFRAESPPDPETLINALGADVARSRQLFDPDAVDPRIELQLSPSMPFRRREERRLMIIDDSVAPMRKDPQDAIVPVDLRDEKERLIDLVDRLDCRVGRIMTLGTWGEAVLVARTAADLRGIALLSWVLDPLVDADGRKRAQPLSKPDFEAKIAAYDKRLEELDERQILSDIGPAKFERRGDLLVLDVLESDGTWDLRKSFAMEIALQATDRFSVIIGAPSGGARPASKPVPEPVPEPVPVPVGPALRVVEREGRIVLVFPEQRWDLDIAAAIGKKDWEAVLRHNDPITAQVRDRVMNDGAGFLAPLEFLSEVFLDGKPLSRPQFDSGAQSHDGGVRTMEVHCPRYGSALLLDLNGKGRFITSEIAAGATILELLP